MSGKCLRHAVLLSAVAGFVSLSSGCTSNEIPLVEFPKGAPPPPPPSKTDPKNLGAVSQGDPLEISK